MNVVGRAADFDGLHSILPGDAAQERPEPLTEWRLDQRPALFGAEDAMDEIAYVRVGHEAPSLRDSG